jgi:hypothetical protein
MSSDKPKRIGYSLLPLLALGAGIILKIAFIDAIPSSGQYQYMVANYLRPLWIELTVSAYVLSAGILLTKISKIPDKVRKQIFWVPIGCFVICIFFALVLPKFGVVSEFITGWLPAFLGLGAIAWVGYLITGVSE